MDHWLLMICIVLAISQVEAQNRDLQPNHSPISGKDGFSKLNETIIEGIQEIARLIEDRNQNTTDKILENIQIVRDEMRREMTLVNSRLNSLLQPGTGYGNPARSCTEIISVDPSSPSGYYWIQGDSHKSPLRMFCDMTITCNGVGGGWMKVVKFDVSYSDQSCPSGLRLLTDTRRRCAKHGDSAGCGSTTFPLHGIGYQKVCGNIIGFQVRSTDAFWAYHDNHGLTIDGTYVDGVSLTNGRNPRRHIWTFTSAYGEIQYHKQHYFACPCSYRYLSGHSDIPPFVGNDYFCDSGNRGTYTHSVRTDPLWDGAGCGSASTCCSLHNPPWFTKMLSSATNKDIEMRLCRDENIYSEDIGVESVELYVQ